MKSNIIIATLGIASGTIAGVLLGRCFKVSTKRWRRYMENRQLDSEIRLDLLEYNHLHEDDFLRVHLE